MNRLDQSAWTVALLLSGITAGMFLMDFFGYYPVLPRLSDEAMIKVQQQSLPLRRVIFRACIGGSGLTTLVLLAFCSAGTSRRLLVASLLCLVALVVFTNAAVVPLNREIATWAPPSPPAGWKPFFAQMIARERVRSFVPAIAFALQLIAATIRR